jgi:hypothetical protein
MPHKQEQICIFLFAHNQKYKFGYVKGQYNFVFLKLKKAFKTLNHLDSGQNQNPQNLCSSKPGTQPTSLRAK